MTAGDGYADMQLKTLPTLGEIGYDEYSDEGTPKSPRPKAVLSLTHRSSPRWTLLEATRLQTVPLRLQRRVRSEDPAEVSPQHPAATVQPRSALQQSPHATGRLASGFGSILKPTSVDVRRASGLVGPRCGSAWLRGGHRPAGTNRSAAAVAGSSPGESKSTTSSVTVSQVASRLKEARPSPVDGVGGPTAGRQSALGLRVADREIVTATATMSTKGVFPSRLLHSCETSTEQEEVSRAPREKQAKRPARALSFSFGTDRKRRQRNFLSSFRRQQEPDESTKAPARLVAPSSPILHGRNVHGSPVILGRDRGRSVTLPSSMRTSSLQQQYIAEEEREDRERAKKLDVPRSPSSESRGAETCTPRSVNSSPDCNTTRPWQSPFLRPASAAGSYSTARSAANSSTFPCNSSPSSAKGSAASLHESTDSLTLDDRPGGSISASPSDSPTARASPTPGQRHKGVRRRLSTPPRQTKPSPEPDLPMCDRGRGGGGGGQGGSEVGGRGRVGGGGRQIKRGNSLYDARTRNTIQTVPDPVSCLH